MADAQLLTLEDYVSQLIQAKNYGTISQEVEVELKNELLRQLHDKLISELLNKLSDQEVKELNTFLEVNPTDEQLQKFISSKLADPQGFIANVLLEFRRIYLGIEA